MAEARDYLVALRDHLPPDVRRLPEEKQLEYLSELLSHHHRHHRYNLLLSLSCESPLSLDPIGGQSLLFTPRSQ